MGGVSWIDQCLAPEAADWGEDDVEAVLELAIDLWHDGAGFDDGSDLREYLGMTAAEYAAWAEGRATAADIVAARRAASS